MDQFTCIAQNSVISYKKNYVFTAVGVFGTEKLYDCIQFSAFWVFQYTFNSNFFFLISCLFNYEASISLENFNLNKYIVPLIWFEPQL